MTAARLTGIPASHPVLAAELMLRYKRIPYVRRDLPNRMQKFVLPLAGYKAKTVPVLRIDGRHVQGSTEIARVLDELQPEPPLFPAERGRVEELERWLDLDFQETVRTLGQWAAKRDHSSLLPIALSAKLPVPRVLLRAVMPLLGPAIVARMPVDAAKARAALERLPGELDRLDTAIADGIIGGAAPNAADFQAAASVRLTTLIDALEPVLAGRPVTALAHRLAPDYPGRFRGDLAL